MTLERATVGYTRVAAEERAVIGYIRVSSRDQAETKLSLTNQEEKIKALAVAHDRKIVRIYNDAAESAKDLKRDAIRELIAEIEKGKIGHVIIYKLDRLTRNLEDLGYLLRLFEKKGVTLTSVQESLDTSTAGGRMVVNLLGMIAQWERETIAERTQVALDVKRKRGEKLGGITPYGCRVRQGKLIPHDAEQKVLQAILKARREGRGYQDIAEALNDKKVKPRSGVRWYASTIRAICLRAEIGQPKEAKRA